MCSMGKFCNPCDTFTQSDQVYVEAALAVNNDIFSTLRGKKNEPNPWQARHQSFHPSECSHSSPREIISSHISSLINKNMKTIPSTVDGSDAYQHAFCDESTDAPGLVKGQTTAVRCRAGDSQADSDLLQPPHMKAPLAVAAWLSARWQRDFNRQSYLSQNKLLQICETNIE